MLTVLFTVNYGKVVKVGKVHKVANGRSLEQIIWTVVYMWLPQERKILDGLM